MTTNYYVARALTQKLGLVYENIHACAIGCILFQGDHKDDINCPKCGIAKYKDDVNNVLPMKVLHHFLIIPRLEQLLKTPTMFELMLWHKIVVQMACEASMRLKSLETHLAKVL